MIKARKNIANQTEISNTNTHLTTSHPEVLHEENKPEEEMKFTWKGEMISLDDLPDQNLKPTFLKLHSNYQLTQFPEYTYFGQLSPSGVPHGEGVSIHHVDGCKRYEGERKEGKKHGLAVGISNKGNRQVGRFEDDHPNGDTSYYWANGQKYVGQSKVSEEGYGVLTIPNGEKYIGTWLHGCQEGFCRIIHKNGDLYEGEIVEYCIQGKGTMLFADGRKYVGMWEEGTMYWEGTMYHPDGRVQKGQWSNGKFVG